MLMQPLRNERQVLVQLKASFKIYMNGIPKSALLKCYLSNNKLQGISLLFLCFLLAPTIITFRLPSKVGWKTFHSWNVKEHLSMKSLKTCLLEKIIIVLCSTFFHLRGNENYEERQIKYEIYKFNFYLEQLTKKNFFNYSCL